MIPTLNGSCVQGIYYALSEGETLETPGVRLPSVKEFFGDLALLNSIIHHGTCQTSYSVAEASWYVTCCAVAIRDLPARV